jgi:hypothetical protein
MNRIHACIAKASLGYLGYSIPTIAIDGCEPETSCEVTLEKDQQELTDFELIRLACVGCAPAQRFCSKLE